MATTRIGVVGETMPGERRVALVPDAAARLRGAGMQVLIEAGAGAQAKFPDGAYAAVGATVTSAAEVYDRADVLACVSASQASVAGYKSVLVAADAYGGYFPMMMTVGRRCWSPRRRSRACDPARWWLIWRRARSAGTSRCRGRTPPRRPATG